ncbi:hypothetical protein EHQ53_07415 [Leptospira langatensis]|uniref:Lipoprotein n=1 Tax=Leptospira langatensis TaxID=2484983 RepID=A0A5F1ZWJ2_9LEPT|nr:hypothetical protein [Leptospira langatensis]TGK01529.1 hypothetical protein EHO57_11455 [Leptospira langatensis]TGL42021.1 hypothetical protein EHQ53_07415 [Leptospira langatensis]
MKKINNSFTTILVLIAISLFNTGCFEPSSGNSDENVLGLVALSTMNPIAGNYSAYNGTPDFPGDSYSADGSQITGELAISNTLVAQTFIDATYGNSYLYGIIKEINVAKQVVYVQFRADSSYSQGDFAWYRWTNNGGYLYLCPDLSGVSSQTTLASAKADDLDTYSDPTNINAGCGLNSGFSPTFWTRLQKN